MSNYISILLVIIQVIATHLFWKICVIMYIWFLGFFYQHKAMDK